MIGGIPDRLLAVWRECEVTGLGADRVADRLAQVLTGRG